MGPRVTAVAIAAILLFAACQGSPAPQARTSPSPSPVASPSAVAWAICGGGFWCGTVQVPLDYAHPGNGTIGIALIEKRATDRAHRIGSLFINFGGPGESGVQYFRDGAADDFKALNARFDLVSWDSRGIGLSSPMKCIDGPAMDTYLALDSVLDDPQEKQAAIQADKDFAAACEQRSGDILPFMDTPSGARDLDLMRAAVGDATLTYLGFSYGTLLGQTFAHLFPSHVRALSLDGEVDPTVSANDSALRQVVGFEQNLQAFLTDCRARSSCAYKRSGDPASKLNALMARLDTTPMAVGTRQMTRSLAMTGVLQALYDQSLWPTLDLSLTAVERGDGSALLFLADYYNKRKADGSYESLSNGAFLATFCLDWPVPQDIAAYDQGGPSFAKASPLFGPWSQYGNLQCAYWPAKPTNHGLLTVTGAPPILLVGATNDPATPFSESQSVNRQIEGSILLTRQGNGHTSYDASACVHAAEDAYLINLTLPAVGAVCN